MRVCEDEGAGAAIIPLTVTLYTAVRALEPQNPESVTAPRVLEPYNQESR